MAEMAAVAAATTTTTATTARALEGLCDDGRHSAAMSVPCGRLADGPIWDVPGRPKKEGKC